MSGRVHAEVQVKVPSTPTRSFIPMQNRFLQKKSILGGMSGLASEFADSRSKHLVSQPPLIQTKLTIGQPNDRYEQEVDRVAEQVMRMPEPRLQRQVEPDEEEEEELIQAKETSGRTLHVSPIVQTQIHSLRGGGQRLSPSMRNFFEPRFGHDFSQVRVHTDAKAAESARAVNARAFTIGRDVVFGAGRYAPETSAGRQLLAHELTHMVQQEVSSVEPRVQRTFRLRELLTPKGKVLRPNPVAPKPKTYFYPGSARNKSNRRAMVVAGIHGTEVSARQLGNEVNNQLSKGTKFTDFHAIVIPRANPTSKRGTSKKMKDLNREFGAGYTSRDPYAKTIASIVKEFDPERILSVHAIRSKRSAGIFLDPIHKGAYPKLIGAKTRRRAFTGDKRNVKAMRLTEAMIRKLGKGWRYTKGNKPRNYFPASEYPTPPGGRSAYSLIYPKQSQVSRSLGTWASGLGKTVITIEIPGQRAKRAVWRAFLPAVWHFLQIPTSTSATQTGGQPIQPKLKVGPPVDQYEQEADRVADAVMRMPEPGVQRQPEPSEEEDEEKPIQPKSNNNMAPQVTSGIAHDILSLKGTGQPLPASEREFFEPRFGRDFSNVRVHTDDRAARASQSINAQAFTLGRNIVFGSGQYQTGTERGNKLLAPELTHVVQQGASIHRSPAPVTGRPSTKRQPSKTPRRQSSSNKGTGVLDYITGTIRLLGHEYDLIKGKLYSQYLWVGDVHTSATSIPAGKLPPMQYSIWRLAGSMFRGMLIPIYAKGDLKKDAESGSTLSKTIGRWVKKWRKSTYGWETIQSKDYNMKKGKKIGIRKTGGPTIETTLNKLYKIVGRKGANKCYTKPTLTKENAKVVRAVAHAECSGRIGCVNTYDPAVVSVGFKQVTLRYNSLQKTIKKNKKTESAFKKHGIELEKDSYQIGNDKFRKIKGAATHNVLRGSKWALKFYAASMENDVVRELVRRVLETKKLTVKKLKGKRKAYFKDNELVALLTQLHNNCPACCKKVLKYSFYDRRSLKRDAAKVVKLTPNTATYKKFLKNFLQKRKGFFNSILPIYIEKAYKTTKRAKKLWGIGQKIWKIVRALYKGYKPELQYSP